MEEETWDQCTLAEIKARIAMWRSINGILVDVASVVTMVKEGVTEIKAQAMEAASAELAKRMA